MPAIGRKRETFLAALLAGNSIKDAAREAGIGERTGKRWMSEAEFRSEYDRARRELVQQATSRLRKSMNRSVDTLDSIAADSDAPPASRVSAGRAIVELGLKAVVLEDLENRIRQLEESLKGENDV